MSNETRRTLNQERRAIAAAKQVPLSPKEQEKRRQARAENKAFHYPKPPQYDPWPTHNDVPPVEPYVEKPSA